MQPAAIAFGNPSPFEVALICVAGHLLFHARKLGFVTSDSVRYALKEREFFRPPLLTVTVFLLTWAAASAVVALL